MEELDLAAELPWVRTSERGSFKKCMQQWQWCYIERLVPVNMVIGAREFGTGIHLCMERYYKVGTERGVPLVDTWNEWCDEVGKSGVSFTNEDDEKDWMDKKVMGRELLELHQEVYLGDPQWEVIATEIHFQAIINGKAIGVGTIDLVVRNIETGKIYIVDHKTCSSFPNFDWLELDDQCGSYSTIAETILRDKGLIGPRERVSGMLYNYIRKGKVDDRPVDELGRSLNKDGTVSKRQPAPLLHRHPVGRTVKEKNRQLQRMADDVFVMDMARKGELPILKAPSQNCPWCDYFMLCRIDESKGDTDMFKQRMFKTRDPYADHRAGAESSKIFVGKGV